MIAGFIFLRLRGILKKTGHEEDMASSFAHDFNFKKFKQLKKKFMSLMKMRKGIFKRSEDCI